MRRYLVEENLKFGEEQLCGEWEEILFEKKKNLAVEKKWFGENGEKKFGRRKEKKLVGEQKKLRGGLSGVLGCIIILRKIRSLTSIVVIITIFLRSLAVARPAAVSIGSDRSRPSAQIFEETDDSSLDPRQPVHSPVAANWPPTNVQPTPTLEHCATATHNTTTDNTNTTAMHHCATATPPTLQDYKTATLQAVAVASDSEVGSRHRLFQDLPIPTEYPAFLRVKPYFGFSFESDYNNKFSKYFLTSASGLSLCGCYCYILSRFCLFVKVGVLCYVKLIVKHS